MITIKKQDAKGWVRCRSCNEMLRTWEPYLQVYDDKKPVKEEKYCVRCEKYAKYNNGVT